MIYGTPITRVADDQTDRIGIRTLTLTRMWQASKWPLSIPEIDAESPPIPEVAAGLFYVGRQTTSMRGYFLTRWTFEGISGNGKDVTFKTRLNSPDYKFEPGFSQVAIGSHPDIQALLNNYGGYNDGGQIRFPEFLPPRQTSGTVTERGTQDLSPMFGIEDFYRMEGTYSFRYGALSISNVEDGVGSVFTSGELPGHAPDVVDRNWLKAPSTWRRRGGIFDITESYWLSGRTGWCAPLYPRYTGGALGGR